MAVTDQFRLPYGMPKPRLKKVALTSTWTCTLIDAKGQCWVGIGLNPKGAYIDLVQKVNYLERLGLRWEVFP